MRLMGSAARNINRAALGGQAPLIFGLRASNADDKAGRVGSDIFFSFPCMSKNRLQKAFFHVLSFQFYQR
jgi:hypothetical protein